MPSLRACRLVRRGGFAAALALIACCAFSGLASAHIGLSPDEAPADANARLTFAVGHGCKGSPTVRLRLRIPEGVGSAKPAPKPGWELTLTRSATGTPSEIIWTGRLPDDYFDEFVVQVRLPNKPGDTLYFPVVQECEQGVHRWIAIPAKGQDSDDLDEPAPSLKLKAKAAGHHH